MKFFLAIFLLTAMIIFSPSARADGPSTEALAMAHVVAPPTLLKLCAQVIQNTTTYKGAVINLGREKAGVLFSKLMDTELPNYSPQWETVNANAYEGLLTPAQMTDMATGHPSFLTTLKFESVANQAGARIQEKGKPILIAYSSAVLADAMKSGALKSAK